MLLHEFIDRGWDQWHDLIAIDIPPGRDRPERITATYAALVQLSLSIGSQVRPAVTEAATSTADPIVAILLPRHTVAAFAALIGVMREGAAYAAIDTSFPDDRVRTLIEDSEAAAVLTDQAGAARLTRMGLAASRIVTVTPGKSPAEASNGHRLAPTIDSLAYIIYTSGTTGRPKGVMVPHGAISNLVAGDIREFGIGPGDRVGQNSSHSYDSSIEEMWMALACGGTLVVLDDDTARSGPDLVTWLDRERLTVFCPPPTMLRATGVRSPDRLLPGLRLLYVGGEALTDDVVSVWAPGRRLVNGYGPTECAVVATRANIVAGLPITIGRPVPGMSAWILDETLAPVRPGGIGELCLGGRGLARGYWHRPDLTPLAFPSHPEFGRMYRTGDRARLTSDGDIVCLGRGDSQVKIRGHRVELEEIEARLAALPGVRSAASRLQAAGGRQSLVAFVVPESGAAVEVNSLRGALAAQLPSHMVPIQIGVLDELPITTGGKLDRGSLPQVLSIDGHEASAAGARALTAAELQVEMALRSVLRADTAIAPDAHFFQDLGVDSLLAAELVTHLRLSADARSLTVRDAYEAPTIASLAERMATTGASEEVMRVRPSLAGRPWLVTLVQCFWLALGVTAASALSYFVFFALLPAVAARLGALITALVWPVGAAVAILLYLPVSLGVAVMTKRLFIGTYTPHRGPVWSMFYVRNWIVRQSLRLVPWRLMEGTVFQLAALRAFGARIGQRVHIHRGVDLLQGGWDLLDIGDDVTIGQEAIVQLVDLEDEQIVVAPVTIRSNATVDIRASVGGGTTIEEGGYLTTLSSLPAGARLPRFECWDGVPAAPAGRAPDAPPLDRVTYSLSPLAHGAAMLATRVGGLLLAPAVASLVAAWLIYAYAFDAEALVRWLSRPFFDIRAVLLVTAAGLLSAPLLLLTQLALIRALGRVTPGVVDRWSVDYFRVWAKTDLVRKAGDWLSGTLLWGIWLRAAGMRVGRDTEISTIIDVVPELVSIGDSTFCADGIYLGGPRVHRGTVTLSETRLGRGLFLGNHVVIPAGVNVPDDVLLGVCTVAHPEIEAGSAWFGHPPFKLSRPAQPKLDPSLTHRPSLIRLINRWFWELGRFAIPVAPALTALELARAFVAMQEIYSAWTMALVVTPALVATAATVMCAFVLLMKWLLLGRVQPGEHALWSCWCSRWDFHYTLWDRLATPVLSRLEGTLLLAWFLRATGMRIGKRVVLGPGFSQVVDPDMIQIDDDATVHALFQAHTFEDRLLKIDRVRIRARATVGSGAVVFYGVDIGEGVSVAPQSVIMKRERLTAGGHYEGCPSRARTAT